MRGEEVAEAFVGFAGVHGDRIYSFRSSAAPAGFPYFTGREFPGMLAYRAVYRSPSAMRFPANMAESEAMAPGLTMLSASAADCAVEVETPDGERYPVDEPALIGKIRTQTHERHELDLMRSDRALTDCRPVSLISHGTIARIGESLDKRRFRANVYASLSESEDSLIGQRVRIGASVELMVLKRDVRCKMITLDPETGAADPEIMKKVARDHDGCAGVYCAVLIEGVIRKGDEIAVLEL
jgi:uncharacterized protein YcbX